MNREAFGKRLKQVRNEKNLTSDKLSELVQVNPVFVRQIEKGDKLPSVPKLVEFCCALKVSPNYLLGEDLLFKSDDRLEEIVYKLHTLSPKQFDLVYSTINAMIEHL